MIRVEMSHSLSLGTDEGDRQVLCGQPVYESYLLQYSSSKVVTDPHRFVTVTYWLFNSVGLG